MKGPRVLRGVTVLVFLLVGLALGGSASAGSRILRMVPLVEYWNGSSWTQVAVAPAGAAVAGDSSHDVWAVGEYYRVAADGDHAVHPLVLHWNGTRWTAVSSPDPAGSGHRSFLSGAVAPSPTGVWAVGSAVRHGTHWVQHALAEHWDGTSWHIVPTTDNPLTGVSGLSANDIWAAGGMTGGDVTHWDGSAWTVHTKLAHDDALTAVAEVSPTNVWAVGVRFVY